MPTDLDSLDETIVEGQSSPAHYTLHSDANYWLKRVATIYDTVRVAAATTTLLLATQQSGDLLARLVIRADGTIAMGDAPRTVSTVAGTSTVTVTTTADHGYGTGDIVTISGVAGFAGANGSFTITRTGATTFTLDGATGSGTYTSGGTVQRLLGTSGSANEGVWNLVVPDGETTRYGLVVRLNSSSTKAGFKVVDHKGADIFFVNPSGGCGLLSADANDTISAATGTATTDRTFAANSNGRVRVAAGDPGGGDGVLAVGDAVTEPTGNPDGTNTVESGYTTSAGAVAWSRDGRLRLRTATGHEDEVMAPLHRRMMSVAAPGGTSTTLLSEGTAAPTVATTSITAAQDDTASGPAVSYTTAASSGVDAGIISAFGLVQSRWDALFYSRLRTDASAITSTRLVAGLVSAEVGGDAGPATTGAYTVAEGAWFRYDTGVDGTAFWRTVSGDGADAEVTTTSVAIAADTSYELIVEVNDDADSVRFWIDGVLVATHATNLPAASTALGYTVRLRTLAAAARALRFGRLMITAI